MVLLSIIRGFGRDANSVGYTAILNMYGTMNQMK